MFLGLTGAKVKSLGMSWGGAVNGKKHNLPFDEKWQYFSKPAQGPWAIDKNSVTVASLIPS